MTKPKIAYKYSVKAQSIENGYLLTGFPFTE